MAINTIEINQD